MAVKNKKRVQVQIDKNLAENKVLLWIGYK